MGLAIIGALSLSVWAYLLCGRGNWWRQTPDRREVPDRDARAIAVIPARDEAEHIGNAVRSLIPQVDRVIVVDGNSSDETAERARAAGATVIAGRPLAEGWAGKLWAVAQGVEAASAAGPEFLLLTDADIVHAAGNVVRLCSRAREDGFDLVSLMVRLRTASPAEKALIPAFVFFFLIGLMISSRRSSACLQLISDFSPRVFVVCFPGAQ